MPLRLKKLDILTIEKHKEHFQKVEAATGVPWEAVAALWYRESFSVTPPVTPGGPFQFDPPPQAHVAYDLLTMFTDLSAAEKKAIVAKGVNDFHAGAYLAACHGRVRCRPKITPNCTDAEIKDFFWSYNGRAKYQGSADGSFYVMNGFDKAHDEMLIVGSIPDKNAPNGRRRIRTKDKRPGAFVVYKQLKGEL